MVFNWVRETADQIVVLVEHFLKGPNYWELGSRKNLTSSFSLVFWVSNKLDLENLGLFNGHWKETADSVINLPLNLKKLHVAMLGDFFVSSKTRHLKTTVILAHVIEKMTALCCFSM